jgi:hypothetical protein
MSQTQRCDVCGRRAMLVEGLIQVRPGDDLGEPLLIGQCPRCHRFLCSRHGEPLDPHGRRRRPVLGRGLLTLCCPFDPGVPLGGEEDAEAPGAVG